MKSAQSASEQEARYEALRHYAMVRDAPIARHGLAVLLRQGVAAWMKTWSGVLAAPVLRSSPDECPNPCPLPDGTNAELVRLLAAMVLGHAQGVAV